MSRSRLRNHYAVEAHFRQAGPHTKTIKAVRHALKQGMHEALKNKASDDMADDIHIAAFVVADDLHIKGRK